MTLEKGTTISVLGHGYVKYVDSMGDDAAIVEAARMSTGRGFVSWDKYFRCRKCDEVWTFEPPMACMGGLIGSENKHDVQTFERGDIGFMEFLYSNKHMTPFEMPELHIEVQAPIMVFREWHRHRTQSYSEFSARYAQMPNLHYLPELGRFQKQSVANKQGSADAFDEYTAHVWQKDLSDEQERTYKTYDYLVEAGLAKEVARINTPISRYSKMRAKTDLRNWLGFLLLRMAPNAQWEIRQFANAVAEIIKALYPRTYELFEEYTSNAVSFSRTEMKILRSLLNEKAGEIQECSTDLGIEQRFYKSLISKLGSMEG